VRDVTIVAVVTADPDAAYRRLADFPRYVELASSVRSVEMSDGGTTSAWEVTFRNGILRWVEQDRYDPVARRIDFIQTAGDMDRFEGWWAVTHTPKGTLITFFAAFDLGLPGLAEVLEPVAAQALEENITDLIGGLFVGEVVRVYADEAQVAG